jgi:hypothetical protein
MKYAMIGAAAFLALALGLGGCASTPENLEVNREGDRRPSTAPLGRLRFDGIYECRGIKMIGSSGGLPGLWTTPATQVRMVYFLKFDANGNGHYTPAEEPFTTEQAAQRFAEMPASPYVRRGRYTITGLNSRSRWARGVSSTLIIWTCKCPSRGNTGS